MKTISTFFGLIAGFAAGSVIGKLVKSTKTYARTKSKFRQINPKSTIGFINKNILHEL